MRQELTKPAYILLAAQRPGLYHVIDFHGAICKYLLEHPLVSADINPTIYSIIDDSDRCAFLENMEGQASWFLKNQVRVNDSLSFSWRSAELFLLEKIYSVWRCLPHSALLLDIITSSTTKVMMNHVMIGGAK